MMDKKYGKLKQLIRSQGSVVVAFSGGVDSSVLAKVAAGKLGDKALAVTLDSPSIPGSEVEEACKVARQIGIAHRVVSHNELENADLIKNSKERCYFCKKEMAKALKEIAEKEGYNTVLEGTNAQDLTGHRPGAKALAEEGVLSPLSEAGFTKEDVRALAQELGLPTSQKPATACLSSRIPYGDEITEERLKVVEEAEEHIRGLGVKQLRVRLHRDVARIEAEPADFHKIIENKESIGKHLKDLGFKYVTLDLRGFRSGSMNE